MNPITNKRLPMLYLSKMESLTLGWKPVDLYQKCEKMLAEWLNDKGGENGET